MFTHSRNTVRNTKPQRTNLHIGQARSSITRLTQATVFSVACVALSACSVSSTVGTAPTEDQIITSSITKPVQPEGIETADAEIIKSVVAGSETSNVLAWQNPDTGNKGTITAIDKFTGSHGQKCKKFQTTVDTFMGISLYNGETCELKKGFWVLSWLLKDQA
jgi:surface antigen